jgi:dipeptidase E
MQPGENGQRILLISSSKIYGSEYLDHAAAEVADTLDGASQVLFIPHALFHRREYAARARERFASMGFSLDSIDDAPDPRPAVRQAEALFVGGGNTFRLLAALYELDLFDAIRGRVADGMPYIGSSAGSIVACPSLGTTKDMPIVEPPSFRALSLVPFQISPHYLDPDPASTHMGETQEERILQFLEENDLAVIGLREGGMLRIRRGTVRLTGVAGARIFSRATEPAEVRPPCSLEGLLTRDREAVR